MSAAEVRFDGPDIEALDVERLKGQLHHVQRLLLRGGWYSLRELATYAGGSEASVSARIRDLRKDRFGALTIDRQRRGPDGLWEYRLVPPDEVEARASSARTSLQERIAKDSERRPRHAVEPAPLSVVGTLDMFPEARISPDEDKDRRYTTAATLALCMRRAGVKSFDLDVAADEECHWALQWYGAGSDGLAQRWWGRVWCNPPYTSLWPWLAKAWREMALADGPALVAMLVPGDRRDQPGWQKHVEPFRDGRAAAVRKENPLAGHTEPRFAVGSPTLETHDLPGRQTFGHPGNKDGVGKSGAMFPSTLLVWRRA